MKEKVAVTGMGVLDFIASLVDSLAWPLAAVIIALVFHKQIGSLVAKVKTLKWGEAAVDFTEKLDKVETEAEALAHATDGQDTPAVAAAPSGRFHELLAISPNAAILDTWSEVENEIRKLGKHHGLVDSPARPSRIGDQLVQSGVLPVGIHKMLAEMRSMRNQAAHGAQTTPEDALRFYQLSQRTLAFIEGSNF
ncbi:hypothetical protein IAG41_05420 [Sphingomonas sp. JC676]|uniref:hypothetical protein n=1 Tax=Sphingomonas sp. JC676 TaxID=2768065 RepID=UPI0016586AA5|nr:hypothetical protein [Sphingomonas sp. JC676]MBC9031823.1 hypothetical protein [Sphingomonas sp. JC676]